MKKTANPDAVPKKDSTAAESIKMTSTERPQLRLVFEPFVGLIACRLSDACKRRCRVPCNPFYGKYTDLIFGDDEAPIVADDTSSVFAPTRGNLPNDLSSMHVALHRRENVAWTGLRRTNHISAICNPADATYHRLLNPTYSNLTKTYPDHGFVNTPQSSLGAPK